MRDRPFTVAALRDAYSAGARPRDVMAEVFRRIDAAADPGIFISLIERERVIEQAQALGRFDPARALWGLPFAVKDNIDVAGIPTTAACPAYSYVPGRDATVVARLRSAGAIPIGKTNLDQFATGLVGTRTPYPVPRNALDPALVPGGSSSGSAVAVARGLVPFALGTDTAGSGRVPAGLNNVVGLKPSLGVISTTGVVPACRTLDTVSILAMTVGDALEVLRVAAAPDPEDPWSRDRPVSPLGAAPPVFRFGIPDPASIVFCDDSTQAAAFDRDVAALEALGGQPVPLDFAPFYEVARLLYEGAWVAERHAVVEALMREQPDALHPITATVIGAATGYSATDAFRGLYRLAELRRVAMAAVDDVDLLCVPTYPRPFTTAELAADPLGPNALLGTYTNFVNLLDLCGLTVPTRPRADGLPASVTLLAPAGGDGGLAAFGRALEADPGRTLGATRWSAPSPPGPDDGPRRPDELVLAVCGAHMAGLALNHELTSRGARFLEATTTAPRYRLYALPGTPARPGLVQVSGDGHAVPLELWALPRTAAGGFLAGIPAPLAIGTVHLADDRDVKGFLCESAALAEGRDITALGGWRAYLDTQAGR